MRSTTCMEENAPSHLHAAQLKLSYLLNCLIACRMAKQAGDRFGLCVLGCHLALEDATRFDLVEELYMLPAKLPVNMHQFATWLEDYVTKLTAADEARAHIEPRRAMSFLTHVGKLLQAPDSLFTMEWVAICRESRLRDDVTVPHLQDVCLSWSL